MVFPIVVNIKTYQHKGNQNDRRKNETLISKKAKGNARVINKSEMKDISNDRNGFAKIKDGRKKILRKSIGTKNSRNNNKAQNDV